MKEVKLSDHFTYRKLIRFVLPSVVMMVFTSIYGVVDGYFVSNYAGKLAFASTNFIMPFLMIIGGTGFMIGTGGSALVAMTLGQGRRKDANRYFTMLVYLTLGLGLLLTVIGILVIRPVALFLGASAEMIDKSVLYGRIVLAFNVAFMLQNLFQSLFIAAEKPKLGLLTTVAAGVTNIILDAILVGALNLNITGAALATGISQCIGGIIPLFYFLRPNSSLLRLTLTKIELKVWVRACSNGFSELMSNVSSSIVGMVYNAQLMKYIGQDGVSAYGVLMYVMFIFVAIFVGYAVGSAPIVAFHYGAGNEKELNNLLTKSFKIMALMGVLMVVAAELLSGPFSSLYVGYDATLYAITKNAFHIFSVSFLLTGINIFVSSFFTALNNGAVSAAISFLRTMLFQNAAVILMPLIMGVDGLWWSQAVAEVAAFLISVIFLVAMRKKYKYF